MTRGGPARSGSMDELIASSICRPIDRPKSWRAVGKHSHQILPYRTPRTDRAIPTAATQSRPHRVADWLTVRSVLNLDCSGFTSELPRAGGHSRLDQCCVVQLESVRMLPLPFTGGAPMPWHMHVRPFRTTWQVLRSWCSETKKCGSAYGRR